MQHRAAEVLVLEIKQVINRCLKVQVVGQNRLENVHNHK